MVNQNTGDLAGCRRDPLPRKPCGYLLESRPVLRRQWNLLDLRGPFQSRAAARGANPRLQFPPQCVQADRGAVNVLPGHDIVRPKRLGDHVRSYRAERCTSMSNRARRAARDLEPASHLCLRHSSYCLMRKNHDPV